MKIVLNNIELYGHHGVHELERKVGLNFQLDLEIEFSEKTKITKLEDTIDYADVFSIVKKEFSIKEKLLEVLCERIMNSLKTSYPMISSIVLKIIKKGAYIEGLIGDIGVESSKTFQG